MPSLLEKLLRIPQPEDLIWRAARQNMERSGGKDLLQGLALELQEQGDRSAIVQENKRSRDHHDPYSPYFSALTLRWDLEAEATHQVSKGVRIVVSHLGSVEVDLTYYKKDWRRWFSLEDVYTLSLEQLPKSLKEMSLEEKVGFAMSVAGHVVDYRHGEKKNSPVFKSESRAWQTIFP